MHMSSLFWCLVVITIIFSIKLVQNFQLSSQCLMYAAYHRLSLLCPARRVGGIKQWYSLSSDIWCLSVCLSVTYIGPTSRTERPRKTHLTPLSRTKCQRSISRGGGMLWQPPAQIVLIWNGWHILLCFIRILSVVFNKISDALTRSCFTVFIP